MEAINKLTHKIDNLGVQPCFMIMVANIFKLAEINAADIKDCKTKLSSLEKEVPALIQENAEMKERLLELERYKRRKNLKLQGRGNKIRKIPKKKSLAS